MLTPLLLLTLTPAQDVTATTPLAPGRRAPKPPVIVNHALAVSSRDYAQTHGGRYLGFFLEEAQHGGVDLNGDGDIVDPVLHVLDVRTGALINHGLAGNDGTLISSEQLFGWRLYEVYQGDADLNGDGDTDDNLPVVVDPLGSPRVFPFTGSLVLAEHPWAGVRGYEPGQDLNGNGTTDDFLVHAWDTSNGDVTHVAVPAVTWTSLTNNGTSLLYTAENGELHAFDAALDQLYPTGLYIPFFDPIVEDGSEVILSNEQTAGTDLNGDGDLADNVLHVFHKPTFTLQNVGVAAGQDYVPYGHGSALGTTAAIEGDLVAFSAAQVLGRAALHLHDIVTRTTTDLGYAVFHYDFKGEHIVFEVREEFQGEDLNGDGDQDAFVLHVHSVATGETVNLGLATQFRRPERFQMTERFVAFKVYEANGNGDVNGNGRSWDEVLFLYDLEKGKLINTLLSTRTSFFQSDETRLMSDKAFFCTVEERFEGDLNGDGDEDDDVLYGIDLPTGRVIPTGLAVRQIVQVIGRRAFVLVSEQDTGRDLNGDGDMLDNTVLHSVVLRP